MNHKQLKQHAETCQTEADNMAYLLLKARKFMQLQSICDFNVWWFADLSPLFMPQETVDFMVENRDKFTKVSLRDFNLYDMIIKEKHPVTFDEFDQYVKSADFEQFSKKQWTRRTNLSLSFSQ
jgi:hypothetical protein